MTQRNGLAGSTNSNLKLDYDYSVSNVWCGGVLALKTGGMPIAIAVEGGEVVSLVMAHGISATGYFA